MRWELIVIRKKEQTRSVAVVYHYFAHYREPVINELIRGSTHTYHFFGDTQSFDSGIKLTEIDPASFTRTKCTQCGPLLFQWSAVKLALSGKYDTLILLGNCKWPTMWLSAIFGRLTGKRVFFWTHGWLRCETGMQAMIRNTFYKIGNGLLLYGHHAKAIGIDYGFSPSKLHVIYNSLDCALQDKARSSLPADARQSTRSQLFPGREAHPVLVNITRLHHYKKLDQLIRAAAKLEESGRAVNVLIVGDGPHKPELEALAQELGVTARFTGAVYGEDELGRMLIASDLAVMPGPIGLLAMHALAYGVPAISHNSFDVQMPEFESIVEGKTGGFFREDDLDSLVETIEHQLGIEWTHEQRMLAARELIERFYNPVSQRMLIDHAVQGEPADDLFNARLPKYSQTGGRP